MRAKLKRLWNNELFTREILEILANEILRKLRGEG